MCTQVVFSNSGGRDAHTHTLLHQFLDLVTLEGELRLRNFEKRETDIIIVATVPGKPIEASDGGERAADPNRLQLLDRAGTIRWRIRLKAGETKVLNYKYERFVPAS